MKGAMSQSQSRDTGTLEKLIASRRPGWSLPQPFYVDDSIYRADIEKIFRTQWLFAGHSCQIPEPGDFFTLEIDTDSLIFIRSDDGQIHALHNVCRHRGTRICNEDFGHAGKLVCPYHQWTYSTDGALLTCRGMHEDLDKSAFSLPKAHLKELEGLIFVCLAEHPPEFQPAADCIAPYARPQRMAEAKVAKIVDYDIPANWKVVWENNRECYHCNVNHPQYIRANFDHYNVDDTTEKIQQRIDKAGARSEQKWGDAGLQVTHKESGMVQFPDAEKGIWYSANRTPLVDGYLSESMDGRQVAPLMGDYTNPDVGTLRIRTLPNFWNHSSCDHCVTTRLNPTGAHSTQARVIWLVHKDAVEGRDYHLEELMPFWQLTSEQDWVICKIAQLGIRSSAYQPGPYSTYKEYNVEAFVRWYLELISR